MPDTLLKKLNESEKAQQWLAVVTLLTSGSTLICCALPALLVTLGFGAALAGLIGTIPQLVWFSEHKLLVFGGCAILLGLGGFFQWNAKKMACPIDFKQRDACLKTRRWSQRIYLFSLVIFLIGSFFAFIIS